MSKQQFVGLYAVGRTASLLIEDTSPSQSSVPVYLATLAHNVARLPVMRRLPLQQLEKVKPGLYVGIVTVDNGCMTTVTVPMKTANESFVDGLVLPELLADCANNIEVLFGMTVVEGDAEASPEYVNQDHS